MNAADNSNPQYDQAPGEQLQQFAVIDGGGTSMLPAAQKGQRLMAGLLDGFFSGILSTLGSTLVIKGLGADTAMVKILWTVIFPVVYFVFPLYASGQTLGKKLMKVKVVHVDPAQEPSMSNLLIRELPGKFISGICLLLGYVRILTHPDRRAWHDSMAKTRVVTVVEE